MAIKISTSQQQGNLFFLPLIMGRPTLDLRFRRRTPAPKSGVPSSKGWMIPRPVTAPKHDPGIRNILSDLPPPGSGGSPGPFDPMSVFVTGINNYAPSMPPNVYASPTFGDSGGGGANDTGGGGSGDAGGTGDTGGTGTGGGGMGDAGGAE